MGTVPVTPNFAAGEFPTAAKLNQIQTALNFLLNPPRCQAYPSAAQSHITSGSYLAVSFDAEDIDTDGMHDLVTNNTRLICQTPGKFEVSGMVTFQPNATGRRIAKIGLNGTQLGLTEYGVAASSTAYASVSIPTIEVSLNVNDYIELYAYQNSGAALAYNVGKNTTWLRAKWCGQ